MSADQSITITRMRTGSIFRLVAAGMFCSLVPFFILMGIFASLGMNSLRWNNEPVYGLKGLVLSPLMGVFAAALFTAFVGVMLALGTWIYSRFRPLTLRVIPATIETKAA